MLEYAGVRAACLDQGHLPVLKCTEEAVVEAELSGPVKNPKEIPGHDLLEKIGEGGTGEVYRAVQVSLRRTVAIKLLKSFDVNARASAALHQESRLLATLSHPHVVTIYDCGQVNGRDYLVMEYLAGPTLRTQMQPGQAWSPERAAPVLDAIARAVSYIHQQGVLHLDLKPENILCTERGVIKITDFGLAVHHLDAKSMSELGLVQGTVDYCAPEQYFGLALDQRSDVFSLATLAYELLTGKLPGRVYFSARKYQPHLPAALDQVLARGLSRDPHDRYGSVEEFRQQLCRALGWPKRRSLLLPILVASLVSMLLAWVILLPWRFDRGSTSGETNLTVLPPIATPAPFAGEDSLLYPHVVGDSSNLVMLRPTGAAPDPLTLGKNRDSYPAFSPDGRRIAFSSNRNGNIDIYVMDADGSNVQQLTTDQGVNRAPAWSPDGKHIAFTTDRDDNSEIYLMDPDGSHQVNLTKSPGFEGDPAWAPDGKTIAFASLGSDQQGFHLCVMDADGKNVRTLFKDNNSYGFVYPCWSPGGTQIAFSGIDSGAIEIFICQPDGSERKRLTKLGGFNSHAAWSPDGKRIAFQHIRSQDSTASLYIVDADGGNLTQILEKAGPSEGGRPAWKPR